VESVLEGIVGHHAALEAPERSAWSPSRRWPRASSGWSASAA